LAPLLGGGGGRESETPRWEKVFANKVGDGDAGGMRALDEATDGVGH
jgi:hypothetical protein